MFIEFFVHIIYAKKINPNKCQFQCFVLFHRDTRVIKIMIRFDRCFVAYFHFPLHFWIFIFVSIIETIFFFPLNLLRLNIYFLSDLRNMDSSINYYFSLLNILFSIFTNYLYQKTNTFRSKVKHILTRSFSTFKSKSRSTELMT